MDKPTLVREVRFYFYSDGTCKWREVKQPPKIERPRRERPQVKPDTLVTCPACGTTFRVGRAQRRG